MLRGSDRTARTVFDDALDGPVQGFANAWFWHDQQFMVVVARRKITAPEAELPVCTVRQGKTDPAGMTCQ